MQLQWLVEVYCEPTRLASGGKRAGEHLLRVRVQLWRLRVGLGQEADAETWGALLRQQQPRVLWYSEGDFLDDARLQAVVAQGDPGVLRRALAI